MAEISMDDLKSNSHNQTDKTEKTDKEPEKKISPVVTGQVMQRRKTLVNRFIDTFFRDGATWDEIKTYLVYEVIVPAIKENVANVVNSAIDMRFFGETSRRSKNKNGGNNTKVNYGGYFGNRQQVERMPSYRHSSVPSRIDDIIFPTRGDAELVLDSMYEILDKFEQVTVSDFYDLCGVTTDFTDNKFGWTNLNGARIVRRGRDEFMIELPRETSLVR